MDRELGGYILVPKQQDEKPYEILSIVLRHLRAEATLYRAHVGDEWLDLSEENIQQLLSDAGSSPGFTFVLGKRWGGVALEAGNRDFSALGIAIDKDALEYPDEAYESGAPWPPEEPEPVHTFVESWLAICEGVHASFGYFSSFTLHSDETYLNASVLPSLQKKDAAKLLNMTIQPNWLVYLGAELVAQGGESLVEEERKKQPLYLECMTVQKTPSGGLFVRTHLDAKGGLYPDEKSWSDESKP